jgi:hypothetical protein
MAGNVAEHDGSNLHAAHSTDPVEFDRQRLGGKAIAFDVGQKGTGVEVNGMNRIDSD